MENNEIENLEMIQAQKKLDYALLSLSEFFDTIQIFCSVHKNGNTINYHQGIGNHFARYGQVACWLEGKEICEDEEEENYAE